METSPQGKIGIGFLLEQRWLQILEVQRMLFQSSRGQKFHPKFIAVLIFSFFREYLTAEEIIKGLESLAGENIVRLNVNGHMDTIEEFILVTGRSTRHLRKMSDMVVRAVSGQLTRLAQIVAINQQFSICVSSSTLCFFFPPDDVPVVMPRSSNHGGFDVPQDSRARRVGRMTTGCASTAGQLQFI